MAARDIKAAKSRVLSASPLVSLITQRKSFEFDSPRKPNDHSRNAFQLMLPSSSDLYLGKSLASNKKSQVGLKITRVPTTKAKISSSIVYPYPLKKTISQHHLAWISQRTLARKELERLRTKEVKVQGKALCFSMTSSCLSSPNQVIHRDSHNGYYRARISQPFSRRSNSISKLLKGRLEDIFKSHRVVSDVKLGVVSTQLKIGH
jgi:hypothetical protein